MDLPSTKNIEQTYPQSRKELKKLTGVPVDKVYAEQLCTILSEHGAAYTLIGEKKYPPTGGPARTFLEYTIEFPPGTIRGWEMTLSSSTPFTILFPDGYELHGWELQAKSKDGYITVLRIPG